MADLPTHMTAIAIRAAGGPEMLVPEQRPMPQPGAGELLVKVAAAGVNRPDVMQRLGLYPPPPGASDIPGLELAGEVVALGPHVNRWKVGDKVTALVAGGGYAEYALVPEPQALPIPAGLTMIEAAALPETYFTVWHNIFERVHLTAGDSILIHGGSSGIGTTAIQLAKAFGASQIFATAGSEKKCEACRKLGADIAINYRTEDFVAVVKSATDKKGVNVILDIVGGDYIQKNYEIASVEGRIAQVAFQDSSKVNVDLRFMLGRRLTHTGSGLRPRSVEDKGKMARALEEKVWPLLAKGQAKPVIDSTFPLAKASDAHARMESSEHIGKIVLTV